MTCSSCREDFKPSRELLKLLQSGHVMIGTNLITFVPTACCRKCGKSAQQLITTQKGKPWPKIPFVPHNK